MRVIVLTNDFHNIDIVENIGTFFCHRMHKSHEITFDVSIFKGSDSYFILTGV